MLDFGTPPHENIVGSQKLNEGSTMVTISGILVNHEVIGEKLNEIMEFINLATNNGCAVHKMEQGLWDRLLKKGWEMMQMYFFSQGNGDEGEHLSTSDRRTSNKT